MVGAIVVGTRVSVRAVVGRVEGASEQKNDCHKRKTTSE